MITKNEINPELLAQVVAEAITKAQAASGQVSRRWMNAIARATHELEANPFMTWQFDSQSLTILSPQSGEVYEANGVCQCRAFVRSQPCWHRAAARLVMRYLEKAH